MVGNVTQETFEARYDWMFPKHADTYFIVVIIDKKKDAVVGSATLMLERKFIRSTGTVRRNISQPYDISADTLKMWQWTLITGGRDWV